jgi:hypothetical protein
MALQAVTIYSSCVYPHLVYANEDEDDAERVELQQEQFDKALGQQGYYVIVSRWGDPYINEDEALRCLYAQTYPKCDAYSHKDITSECYLNMVNLLQDIYTGKLSPKMETNDLYNHQLKWLPIEVVESNAWSYTGNPYAEPWSLCINHEQVELRLLKKYICKTAEHLRTILQTDDPFSSMVGLLNPLLQLSAGDDVGEVLKEVVELAPLVPGVGAEYKQALERFEETK